MKKSNVWTIVRKEFARFFGDKSLVFTAILMPGLLIYLVYSVMGDSIGNQHKADTDMPPAVYVDNLPPTMEPLFDSLPLRVIRHGFNAVALVGDSLKEKECNLVYVNFPSGFDSLVANYDPQSGLPAPNVRIYYNSISDNSNMAYNFVCAALDGWESSICNLFDINTQDPENEESFNAASDDEVLGDMLSQLIPMLIMTLLFSGCMAVAPAAIAGEKERGTIATLLVTPMRRHELAIGKILSLSTFALLSGLSSFIGIILSLPKLAHSDEIGSTLGYGAADYLMLLGVLLSTVLVMVSFVSIISAYAKNVKSASTMVTPLMLVIMFVGLMPMLGGGDPSSAWLYAIPFYNSVVSMSSVFAFEASGVAVLVTVVANVCYTALSVYVLARMFNSEKVMFGK